MDLHSIAASMDLLTLQYVYDIQHMYNRDSMLIGLNWIAPSISPGPFQALRPELTSQSKLKQFAITCQKKKANCIANKQ
jgi:hypothetical protein